MSTTLDRTGSPELGLSRSPGGGTRPQPGNPGVRSVLCVHIVENVRNLDAQNAMDALGCCLGCCHAPRLRAGRSQVQILSPRSRRKPRIGALAGLSTFRLSPRSTRRGTRRGTNLGAHGEAGEESPSVELDESAASGRAAFAGGCRLSRALRWRAARRCGTHRGRRSVEQAADLAGVNGQARARGCRCPPRTRAGGRALAVRDWTVVFLKLFAPCEVLMRRLKPGQ
jgi:hypothetical protein